MAQPDHQRGVGDIQAEAHEWDLADGLIHLLSAPAPEGSASAHVRTTMMQQLRSDATEALLLSSSPDTARRAMRVLSAFNQPHQLATDTGQEDAEDAQPPTLLDLAEEPLTTVSRQPSAEGQGWPQGADLPLYAAISEPAHIDQLYGSCQTGISQMHGPSFWTGRSAGEGSCGGEAPFEYRDQTSCDAVFSGRSAISGSAPYHTDGTLPHMSTLHKNPLRLGRATAARPSGLSPDLGGISEPETPSPTRLLRRARLAKRHYTPDPSPSPSPTRQSAATKPLKRPRPGSWRVLSDADRSASPQRRSRAPGVGGRRKVRRGSRGFKGASASQTSSGFRGVSRHRLTQRWEASLWLSGKQLYLGGFESESDAAKAYDIAALASKGPNVATNFSAASYSRELLELRNAAKEEIVAYVRRRSSAFSRGRSAFRGVSGKDGRWEARIGAFEGEKNVSFGIFESEDQAARQYDRALIIEKGRGAKSNFPLSDYEREVERFEGLLKERYGNLRGQALQRAAERFQLPLELNLPDGTIALPLLEKGRGGRPRNSSATQIYAESLRKALS